MSKSLGYNPLADWKDEWGPKPTRITNKTFNAGKRVGFVAGFAVGFAVCLLFGCLLIANS